MADTLQSLGFTLVGGGPQFNLDKAAFDKAVQDFGANCKVRCWSFLLRGHGVQMRGSNYLVPINANPTREIFRCSMPRLCSADRKSVV